MAQILRRVAVSGLGLALATFFAFAETAHAQGEVTVGGVVEVVGGVSDTGQDGLDRGLFSRINVGYTNTLENGLVISGSISYQVNQRGSGGTAAVNTDDINEMMMTDGSGMMMDDMDIDVTGFESTTNYAPDILSLSVGGGFGTLSFGAHAPASCAVLPRPIAFVPAGVNFTWYTLFTGFDSMNATFSEANYCGTSEAISYATPSMGGLSAMVTYAPNMAANQGVSIGNAVDQAGNKPDYVSIAGSFSTDMGGANFALGAAFQTSDEDMDGNKIDSAAISGTVGLGGASLGFAWFENSGNADANDDIDGMSLAAKYSLGAITPGVVYSVQENGAGEEETALVVGASYAIGGGMSAMVEYISLDESGGGADDEDTLLMGAISVAF
ncbi:MAG: porin [Alphaproteobacteria bacterium]|nr:porin [Alphaproteobacteria bacterium]